MKKDEKAISKAINESGKTPLTIGAIQIPCYVLEDGTAVLSGRAMQEAVGFTKLSAGSALKNLLKREEFKPYNSEAVLKALNNPIKFLRTGRGGASGSQPITHGYEATILIDICYVFIDAKNGGVKLTDKELALAHQADIVVRAFSKTGIISVIYKLTGYLDDKVRTFLNDILNKYLLAEAKKYKVTFPLELYKEWYRLNNWEWKPESKQKRPSVLGHWTNDFIYSRIAPKLLQELKIRNAKNEKGRRPHKYFQFLTDEVGEPRLREFFGGLIALSKAATTWKKYVGMINKAYPKFGQTIEIPYEEVE